MARRSDSAHRRPLRGGVTRRSVLSAAAALGGCASRFEPVAAAGWDAVPLPGKRQTVYTRREHEGRPAWHASSQRAASVWRRRVSTVVTRSTHAEFAWWVGATIAGANLSRAEAADSPVRVAFAFDGDMARLSMRNRLQFQLAEALTGEAPPFATLMYVWDNHAAVESVVPGARNDRVRNVVLESGDTHLRRWRDYRRNLFEDFRRAFGESPGRLTAIALMTDTDNTGGTAEAWYGDVALKG